MYRTNKFVPEASQRKISEREYSDKDDAKTFWRVFQIASFVGIGILLFLTYRAFVNNLNVLEIGIPTVFVLFANFYCSKKIKQYQFVVEQYYRQLSK